ncbi:hypothetical protein NIES4074_07740 [Cylindrospermum sp. NIES-4074]|nr:hypothetical protein NIES4074_07740 [Cylindrospermum sp. NIES-4074]
MQSALEHFRISIQRVRDLIALHTSIKAQATAALDISDILRSALVLSVSALDYYVHEVVTLGMLKIYRGERAEPATSANTTQSAFSRFQVSLGNASEDRTIAIDIASWIESDIQKIHGPEFLQQSHTIPGLIPVISDVILKKLNNTSWLEDEIRKSLSYKSFQEPDKIADAIRLISDKKLWDEVAIKISGNIKQAQPIKQQLSFIVDRRNKIAHEADIDPSLGIGYRWDIDELMVNDAVSFIEQVVESIHQIL